MRSTFRQISCINKEAMFHEAEHGLALSQLRSLSWISGNEWDMGKAEGF